MPRDVAGYTTEEVRPCAAWSWTCPTIFDGVPVQPRRFIVDQWLPAATVTINYGDGGTGKTLLAQQLMTSCATGRPWLGLAVERCRTLALFCEDDDAELHRRQHAINLAYGVDFPDLADMKWTSGVGVDNTLATFDAGGWVSPSESFKKLEAQASLFHPDLIVIDTAADTFGGNENDRRQVRQYVGAILGKLAQETKAAVLLNAHPSRSGLSAGGDLDGGSTAWSNTARSRWSLARPKGEGDEPGDTNERILTRRKANYASIGDTIKCRWQDGVLVPTQAATGLAAIAQQANADAMFLTLLARCTGEGRPLSDSPNASNAAPRVFGKRPDREGHHRREFEAAMQRLFAAGKIRMEPYGRPNDRGQPRRIVAVGAPSDA